MQVEISVLSDMQVEVSEMRVDVLSDMQVEVSEMRVDVLSDRQLGVLSDMQVEIVSDMQVELSDIQWRCQTFSGGVRHSVEVSDMQIKMFSFDPRHSLSEKPSVF